MKLSSGQKSVHVLMMGEFLFLLLRSASTLTYFLFGVRVGSDSLPDASATVGSNNCLSTRPNKRKVLDEYIEWPEKRARIHDM